MPSELIATFKTLKDFKTTKILETVKTRDLPSFDNFQWTAAELAGNVGTRCYYVTSFTREK